MVKNAGNSRRIGSRFSQATNWNSGLGKMVDIWNNTATSLNNEVDAAIWELRESEIVKNMESEIERAFAVAFAMTMRIDGNKYALSKTPPAGCGYFLIPQDEIGQYRVDFMFGYSHAEDALVPPRSCVVVECDGHDWHERTKDQAARDKKRDRYLQTQVGAVIHFTGSEIFRNAQVCLIDALKALNAIHGFGGPDEK